MENDELKERFIDKKNLGDRGFFYAFNLIIHHRYD